MHENRETSLVSVRETAADRRAKVRRKARAHAGEESDRGVLPMNRPNKESQLSAEGGEGSPRIKENASPTHTSPTQSGEHVTQGLAGVRQAALTLASKIRAVCGKSARADLCGGHRATDVPTATPEGYLSPDTDPVPPHHPTDPQDCPACRHFGKISRSCNYLRQLHGRPLPGHPARLLDCPDCRNLGYISPTCHYTLKEPQ